jgi:hypothetical protein
MSLLKESPLHEEVKENSFKKVPTLQEFLKKVRHISSLGLNEDKLKFTFSKNGPKFIQVYRTFQNTKVQTPNGQWSQLHWPYMDLYIFIY